MRTQRLRPAELRARKCLSYSLSLCTLAIALTGCGGSDHSATDQQSSLPTTVTGADGAAVHLRQIQRDTAQQATIRVARDSTGAPALDASFTPLGPVYQYTPHGWLEDEIELRVPFQAEGNVVPRLMVAQPGGRWSEVVDARREGAFMVGRVLQLGYATVVTSTEGSSFSDRMSALAARARSLSGSEADPVFSISVGGATTPALPAAQAGAWPKVTAHTNLVLDVGHNLPACSVAPEAEVVGMTWQGNLQNIRYVNLGRRALSGQTGTAIYAMPLTEAENGNWVFMASTWCKEPNKAEVSYSKTAYSQKFTVEIGSSTPTPIPAPVVASHPADVAVTAGTSAIFTVSAQGSSLAYEWQRSSDGGVSYGVIPGAVSSTYGLTTALTDNQALFRVRVTNASGSVVSTPALLTVTPIVMAPVVTTDPSSQSVLESESATFTVAGTGQPAPTIQWQQRAAGVAAPEEGWSDVVGANSNSFTVLSLTVAQSGTQFRALLRNSAGVAATLPATVTVSRAAIAPTILSAPQSRTVTAGQFGLFSVAAGGTTPLSYQWFRNGQALVGENASEVLVFADPADSGSNYQITVQISNSVGTVISQAAAMTVALSGTTVDAASGGIVESTDGSALDIPAGALSSNTVVAVTNEVVPQAVLPSGVIALSDAIEIRPAGLQLSSPGELTINISSPIPDGMTIALVDVLPYEAGVLRASAASTGNLRRAAAAGVSGRVKRAAVSGVNIPSNLSCGNVQNINTDGKYKVAILSAIRKVAVAVPVSQCASVEEIAQEPFPRDTFEACSGSSQFAPAGSNAGLINRHVQCVSGVSTSQAIAADFELVSTNQNTGVNNWRLVRNPRSVGGGLVSTFQLGLGDLHTELSISGSSGTRSKRVTVRQRFVNLVRTEIDSRYNTGDFVQQSVRTRPLFRCVGTRSASNCSFTAPILNVPLNGGWSQPVGFDVTFDWAAGSGEWDLETFDLYGSEFHLAVGDAAFERFNQNPPYSLHASVYLEQIRCDRNIAHNGSEGCVFPRAAAVMVLNRTDASVREAAEHILEAQNGPRQSPGRFVMLQGSRALADSSTSALHRAKDTRFANLNRSRACQADDSLHKTRLPLFQSASCAARLQPCSCDEYPFAATWEGGFMQPEQTSAKEISHAQNMSAGSGRITSFFRKERVLDLTRYPTSGPFDLSTIVREGGDGFWVYVN